MTMRVGFRKHCTAFPSSRNSGFTAMPISLPAFFPEAFSSRGMITCSVVPGATVLLTAMTW